MLVIKLTSILILEQRGMVAFGEGKCSHALQVLKMLTIVIVRRPMLIRMGI